MSAIIGQRAAFIGHVVARHLNDGFSVVTFIYLFIYLFVDFQMTEPIVIIFV